MKKVFKVIGSIFIALLIVYFSFLMFTDNQYSCYIKSKFGETNENKQFNKIEKIDTVQLQALLSSHPNTIYYFATYYCPFSCEALYLGSEYDSLVKKDIVYITVDNNFALSKIEELIADNVNIKKIYHLDDKFFSGIYYNKGWNIVKNYLPSSYTGKTKHLPFRLISDSNGKIFELK